MKKLTIALLLTTALLGADKKEAKKDTQKPANQPAEVTIPAGAQETEDGSYRYTDPQGKKWLFRKTPFGIAKSEEKPVPVVQPQQEDSLTKATVNGDSVHFERPTPFGVTKWDKKVAELDANEQRILDRQKNKQ
jgi:hypothetical protein